MTFNKSFWLAFGLLVTAMGGVANAQSFPTKPIKLICAFAPGGGTDVLARLVAKKLSADLGQPVVVENRAGADGAIAGGLVARADPDGLTILITGAGSVTVNPHIKKDLAYDPNKDLAPVSLLTKFSVLLVVPPSSPFKTVKDIVAKAKESGKAPTYASPATGSASHIAGEMFNRTAGIKLTHVPYPGSAPAMTAVLGGHVDLQFGAPQSVIAQVREGQLKALAYGGDERSTIFPEIPTMIEEGVPNFNVSNWLGLFVPSKTPPQIIARLSESVQKIMKDPETQEFLKRDGSEVVGGSPEDFKKQIDKDNAEMGKLLPELKLGGD